MHCHRQEIREAKGTEAAAWGERSGRSSEDAAQRRRQKWSGEDAAHRRDAPRNKTDGLRGGEIRASSRVNERGGGERRGKESSSIEMVRANASWARPNQEENRKPRVYDAMRIERCTRKRQWCPEEKKKSPMVCHMGREREEDISVHSNGAHQARPAGKPRKAEVSATLHLAALSLSRGGHE